MKPRILIIAAHPDDEILGCGATVSRWVKAGAEAATVILGEGITSRDTTRNRSLREKEITELKKQIVAANRLIGIERVYTYDFPDNRFDSVDLLDIVKTINQVKEDFQPDIIFTHARNDLNVDHQITYHAVLIATRPLAGETVHTVYAFEVLSSSEWNYPLSFSPSVYYDVSQTIEDKIRAMAVYKGELRSYPHPRSLQGIRIKAQQRGLEVNMEFAEAFELIRQCHR